MQQKITFLFFSFYHKFFDILLSVHCIYDHNTFLFDAFFFYLFPFLTYFCTSYLLHTLVNLHFFIIFSCFFFTSSIMVSIICFFNIYLYFLHNNSLFIIFLLIFAIYFYGIVFLVPFVLLISFDICSLLKYLYYFDNILLLFFYQHGYEIYQVFFLYYFGVSSFFTIKNVFC